MRAAGEDAERPDVRRLALQSGAPLHAHVA
jgi:hypothetical protein